MYSAYISKHKSNHEKQAILSMIPNKKGWMTLSWSKKLSALSRGATSKHHNHFYCLSSLHSFPTGKKRESQLF